MTVVEEVKVLLGIEGTDLDDKLTLIAETAGRQLLSRLPACVEVVPVQLGYIWREVVVKRFNRISNEGMTSFSQDGESITYAEDDFAEFSKDIQAYNESVGSKKGRLKFL